MGSLAKGNEPFFIHIIRVLQLEGLFIYM